MPPERQSAELGECRALQQDGFPGNRDTGVFEQDADEYDRISVPREEIEQPFRH